MTILRFSLGDLQISLATQVKDYYSLAVQSTNNFTYSDTLFEGIIDYEVAQSQCAVLSKAPWVVLNPGAGISALGVSENEGGEPEGEPEVPTIVYFDQDESEG